MFDGITQTLAVVVCENAYAAAAQGHIYTNPTDGFKALEITRAVVVKDGTESGKPTVDLVLQDAEGNKYVTMITAALLKSIPTNV